MKSATIEIPQGYEIDTVDHKTGKVEFKKSGSIMDRIKTIEDVFADNRTSKLAFNNLSEELEPDEKAYRLLKLIVLSLNEGWTPDWNSPNEYKYYPWFEMRGSSGFRFNDYDIWNSVSYVGSRLCFKSAELAEYAGRTFKEIYEDFMTIKQ